jgi:hypothetical protein
MHLEITHAITRDIELTVMVSTQAQTSKRHNEPSQGSLSISPATLAHRWVPYAARYQTCRPDISHSLQRVHQPANAVANPVNYKLNIGDINIFDFHPPRLCALVMSADLRAREV